MEFQGIFEIGPTDGGITNNDYTPVKLNAVGTSWGVLLPMCDGDIKEHTGMKPFDRMIGLRDDAFNKGGMIVLGTNHNTYNTEWQQSDAINCMQHRRLFPRNGLSEDTQATAILSVLPFFLATVGENKQPELFDFFNPIHPLPEEFTSITTAQRVFLQPGGKVISDFYIDDTSTNEVGGDVVVHYTNYPGRPIIQHASDLQFAVAKWGWGGPSSYLTVPFLGGSVIVGDYTFLEFRTSRGCEDQDCFKPSSGNPKVLDFSISLKEVTSGEWTNSVSLKDYIPLLRLFGAKLGEGDRIYHPSLESVRIPLRDFDVDTSTIISQVRFTFDKSPNAEAWITNIALGKGEVPEEARGNSSTSSSATSTLEDEKEFEDISIVNDKGDTVEEHYVLTVTSNTVKVCSNFYNFVRSQVSNYIFIIGSKQLPTNIDPEDTYCIYTVLPSEDCEDLLNSDIYVSTDEAELDDKYLVGELSECSAVDTVDIIESAKATMCEGFNTNKKCVKWSNGNCKWVDMSCVTGSSASALNEQNINAEEPVKMSQPNSAATVSQVLFATKISAAVFAGLVMMLCGRN